MGRNKETLLRHFHQARWDEEIICEMSVPGERGILVPRAEEAICAEVGDGLSAIPEYLRRKQPPALPEVGQMRVLRHFLHLSQETMGADVTIDIGEGTCTMKYSPKVQEHLAARHPGMTEIHPLQDDATLQGILEIYYKLEQFLKEISGLNYFSLQPSSGSQAIYANACIIRAYHASRGNRERDEIVTTLFSHPVDAAAPATAGYKLITLMPGENGYPDFGALKASLSKRTAAIFITNPKIQASTIPGLTPMFKRRTTWERCALTTRPMQTVCWASHGPKRPGLTSVTSTFIRRSQRRTDAWDRPWERWV